jgi:serine/threonine-protein kinase
MRERIGRYEVTGMLGEGGMGIVYAGRDPQLGRPLAIKTLRDASRDPVARERLTREARTAAGINHPFVCQLYEIGDVEGDLYLAMEMLIHITHQHGPPWDVYTA